MHDRAEATDDGTSIGPYLARIISAKYPRKLVLMVSPNARDAQAMMRQAWDEIGGDRALRFRYLLDVNAMTIIERRRRGSLRFAYAEPHSLAGDAPAAILLDGGLSEPQRRLIEAVWPS